MDRRTDKQMDGQTELLYQYRASADARLKAILCAKKSTKKSNQHVVPKNDKYRSMQNM